MNEFVYAVASGAGTISNHAGEPRIGIVTAIQISIVAASILAVILHRIKQPSLVAYIAAGLFLGVFTRPLIGSSLEGMEHVSSLGLILLLFVIGLELDLKKVLGLGKGPAAAIFLQGPVTIGAIWGIQSLLRHLGIQLPGLASRPEGQLIFAAAAALSSTAVVVRLLGDKFDLTSQAGRITVLTLIAQDIWAVTMLSYISSQGGDSSKGPMKIVYSILAGIAVAGFMVWITRRVISRILKFAATAPDLMSMAALAWCFLGSAMFGATGLSAEMGALIAGLTIGSLPQAGEVLSKISNLRDFFMALFFVTLGMTLPPPTLSAVAGACILTLIVCLSRFLLFVPTLLAARMGTIVSLTAGINLAQLSEFSLLLLPVGVAYQCITQEEASVISYALMLSLILSPFAIRFNYSIARGLARLLHFQAGDPFQQSREVSNGDTAHPAAEIYLLGYYHNAEALVGCIQKTCPDLLSRMLVIDYNLAHHDRIRKLGLQVKYGDIGNLETLRHAGIENARVVVVTISNAFLRGTSNERLIDMVHSIAPRAKVISTSVRMEELTEQTSRGAFASIYDPAHAAQAYLDAIQKAIG